jgi:hypothetical protein
MALFISYSRLDREVVEKLVNTVRLIDDQVWFDEHLAGGQDGGAKSSNASASAMHSSLRCRRTRSSPDTARPSYSMAANSGETSCQLPSERSTASG